jgi:hypothetical protein
MTNPPTLAQIRQAIVTTVQANITSEVVEYANVPDVVQCPAIVVRPLSAKYIVNMGDDATYEFQVFVLCSRRDTDTSQEDLDAFVSHYGPDSVPSAINDNMDLGIEGAQALCYAMDGYGGKFQSAQIPHVGAILKVRVEADP